MTFPMSVPRFRPTRILMLAALASALGSEADAQPIPGMQGPSPKEMATEYQLAMRTEVTATLQDWTTLWERDQADALARYYTDTALLQSADGALHRGRDAIRHAWTQQLSARSNLRAEFSEVLAGNRIAYATGRVAYEVSADDGAVYPEVQTFMMVFEKQRGRWLIRSQAFAAADANAAGSAFGRRAVRDNRKAVHPPERQVTRLVFEPFAGNTAWETQPQQAGWNFAGGSLGLELGRVLELRGHYWQSMEAEANGSAPLRSYGGELRTYLGTLWRFQPQLLLGASKLSGTAIPDSMIVPLAGAGLGFRVTNGVSLQFAARDYFPRKAEAPETEGWATLERSQRWMFSGGLSYALGRQPAWRDPEPARHQVEHEANHRPEVIAAMDEWSAALHSGESARLAGLYSGLALLLEPNAGVHRGRQAVQQYWAAQGPRGVTLQPREVRISDRVAFVNSDVVLEAAEGEGPTSGQLVTVLEQERGRWVIRAQAFAPVH